MLMAVYIFIRCSTDPNKMGSRAALLIAAAVALVAAAALLPGTASAATYKVGDGSGWDTGVDYDAWASGKKFKLGDTLEFLYSAGSHDVVLVDAQSYAACTVPDNALSLNSGDDKVALRQTGPWYFICDVEGHCESGMKLAVNVD